GMVWKDAHDSKVRKYDYTYDAASRLTGANFGQYTASNFTATKVNYSVSGLTYDENGNIKKLVRTGLLTAGTSTTIDNLAYTYQPGTNKLSAVTDAILNNAGEKLGDFQDGNTSGTDYSYDANGNMTIDKNKKITQVVYNILNLPREIRVNGTAGKGTIRYYYDAGGNKLRKVTIDSTTLPAKQTVTTYIGGSVYQNDTLQFFGTSEGRVRPDAANTAFVYDYFLKDHLGNTRMVITDDYSVSSPILETSSYYPFGLMQKGIGMTATNPNQRNKYLFNSNELQDGEFRDGGGLQLMDFNARMYDMQLGRFWQQDLFANIHPNVSPFIFAYNNPIRLLDPTGLDTLINTGEKDKSGNIIYTGETKLSDVTVRSGVNPNAAHYSYELYSAYYDINHSSGYSDYDIYKNVGNVFSEMNDADWRLYSKASDPGAIAYRAYIFQHAHKDQLFALGIFASPLIIAYSPEVLALASDGAGAGFRAGGKVLDALNEAQWGLSGATVDALSSARAQIAATVISILGKSASPKMVQKITDWGNKFTDPVELAQQIKDVKEFIDNVRDLINR
ncbi:MAG TPA: RHS repeat-associated core domain-containing protein, partial [Arachidicoccus sp.]|nr:RHS repeat-associated core domain-containing protein [Arachidicoccus sp.]